MAKKFSLESVLTLSDKMTAPMGKVSKQVDAFGKKMKKNFGGVGKQINAMNAGINKAARGIGLIAAGGVAASAALIQSSAKQADEWAKQARQIGITAEQLQKLNYVANISGVSAESLTKSYEKMNRNIGDLRAGTGMLTTYLNKTDPAFAEQLKNVESSEDAFAMLIGKINEAPDEFEKASLAQAAFGRAGMDVLRMAEQGEDGIRALMAETEKYGLVSTEAANAAEMFNDEQTRMRQVVLGLKNKAFNALIPVLANILEKLRKLFETSADGTDIIGRFKKMVEGIDIDAVVRDVSNFAKGMVGLGQTIGKVVSFLIKFAPVILAVVAAIKILAAVQTIYNVVLAITMAISSPVILIVLAIVAAVALLAAGVYLMVKHWDKVKAVMAGVIDVFKKVGLTLVKWMLTPINLMLDAVGGLLRVLAKIPGLGDLVGGAADAIDAFQGKMNVTMTGSADAYDYASPWTKGNESRSVSESRQTTVNEVYVRPDRGAAISGARGGAPQQVLMYGAAQ